MGERDELEPSGNPEDLSEVFKEALKLKAGWISVRQAVFSIIVAGCGGPSFSRDRFKEACAFRDDVARALSRACRDELITARGWINYFEQHEFSEMYYFLEEFAEKELRKEPLFSFSTPLHIGNREIGSLKILNPEWFYGLDIFWNLARLSTQAIEALLLLSNCAGKTCARLSRG